MDTFGGNAMFIDVQNPNYLLTQEMCHTITNAVATQNENVAEDDVRQSVGMAFQANVKGHTTTDAVATQSEDAAEDDVRQSVGMAFQANVKGNQISDINSHGETSTNAVASESGVQTNSIKSTAEKSCLAVVSRRFQCPECHRYTAENEEKMIRHIKKVHRGENPFQCYMCDYNTYNKSLFEEHVRIHQGIKPFKCTHCDYKSASKKNLKKHALIHRPNNPLKCGQCEFIGRHPQALKRHQDSHISGEWLQFDSCKYRFRDLAAYKKHEKAHKLKCKQCEYKTCSRPSLKQHMVDEHGFRLEDTLKKENFTCQICRWHSSTITKILLHLIHHPKQTVDENVIDISILRKHGIMT